MSNKIPLKAELPANLKVVRARPAPKNALHLHCFWRQGPAALRGVTKAISICGLKNLNREQVTSDLDDVTCPNCVLRANR